MLYPKLFTTLKNYSRHQFISDLIAGVIVGIVAIPLAIAFAIASGVTPDKGLLTAVVAGFLISVLGGSRVQVGGPTGAFVVIVYGIVHQYGLNGLIMATFMAGIILVVMGLAGLGASIKFIPHPVIVGFTSGIAVIIFSSQLKNFLGLSGGELPAEFLEKWKFLFAHAASFNLFALILASGTVGVIAFWPRISRKIPGSVIALILSTVAAAVFQLPVETIGSKFGDLPNSLPAPAIPAFNFSVMAQLIKPAFTIALLGGIESLLSAVVADGMIGGRHRSNMELVAQGIANLGSALFGGIPATGAIARTVTNIKNGGRTPVAGIVHSLTILLIMLFFGKWAKLIPLACLAGILAVVAYNMSEWRSFASLLKGPRSDVAVLVLTFLITVFFDLTAAIEIGMVLSAFLFMNRMAKITNVKVIARETQDEGEEQEGNPDEPLILKVPEGVEIYEINGPFFFGVSHKFEEAIRTVAKMPKVRILKLKNVPLIDATGLHSLKEFYKKCQHSKTRLIIVGIHSQPLRVMEKSGVLELIGRKNVFTDLRDALKRAEEIIAPSNSLDGAARS